MDNKKGFAILEMVFVVTILGVLLGVVLMFFSNVTELAARRSDEKTIRVLNSATMILAFSEQMSLEDVFKYVSNEMDHLVTMSMLDSKPEPAQKGLSFVWNSDPNTLRWILSSEQPDSLLVNGDWANGLNDWFHAINRVTLSNGIVQATNGESLYLYQRVAIEEGARYTLEFDVRAEGSANHTQSRIHWVKEPNDTSLGTTDLFFNASEEWQRQTLTGTAPKGAEVARVFVFRGMGVTESSKVYVRNVRFWKN